jgi:hypothetical protein
VARSSIPPLLKSGWLFIGQTRQGSGLADYPAYFSLLSLPLPENKSGILKVFADDGLLAAQPSGKFVYYKSWCHSLCRDLNSLNH